MSVKLIKDEKIVKSYEYAISQSKGLFPKSGTKTLTVTNKRIIHEEKFSSLSGCGSNTNQMPVSNATYVNTNLKIIRYPILLVLGIMFAISALGTFITAGELDMPVVLGLIPLIFAVVCFVVFAFKKNYMFFCSIETETRVNHAFDFLGASHNTLTRSLWSHIGRANKTFFIRVKVAPGVAEEMANELGSIIAAAANGDYDGVEVPDEPMPE